MSNTDLRCLFFVRDARSVQGVVDGGMGGGHDQAPKGLFGRSLCFRGEKTHTRAHTSFLYPGSLYPEIVHRGSQRTEAALFHCVFLMLRALWWLVQKWYPIDG